MSHIFTKKFFLLLSLWIGIFCNYACYSIIAPFFPQLARKKGLSAEQYSLVFGVYSLAQITFSIIVGRSLTRIGAKFIVIAGLFLTGGSTILFGCLESSPGGTLFFALCMGVRAVEGAGFAAYLTSSLAVLVKTFPSNPGYYVGLTETVVTVAMISGPPLGSFLYTLGGYSCPFISFGSVILVMSIASYYLIAEDKTDSETKRSDTESLSVREYCRILKMPAGAMILVSVTFNVTADAFILIALSEHLSQFHLTPMVVGSIYLCLFLSYGISSPLSGKIADKWGKEFLLQSGGCLIMTISFVIIGPASFLDMAPKVSFIIAGLLLKGLGAGPLISCSYSAALRAARRSGFPEDFRTYSLVSTLVSFSIPLGNLLGGVTTGIMSEQLGMRVSTTVYGGIFLFLAALCLVIHIHASCQQKKTQEDKWLRLRQNLLQGEEMPLIKKDSRSIKTQDNGRIISATDPVSIEVVVPEEKTLLESEKNSKNQLIKESDIGKKFWLT